MAVDTTRVRDGTVDSVDAVGELSRLADGYLVTQLLFVAVELGIADLLADAPRTAADLAATLSVDRAALHRVLRGLAAERVLDELDGGRFAVTPVGSLLRAGVDGSLRGYVQVRGGLYYGAMAGLLGAVTDRAIPFEVTHGRSIFEHLADHPADAARFQASMSARVAHDAAAVVACVDFSGYRTVVDVGGGRGTLLAAVLDATPGLEGVLFDRPDVVEGAGLPAVGGDFFDEVPSGAGCYVLSRIVHDWDDVDAVAILRTCRRAMPASGTLLLVEAMLPARAVDSPAAVRMDLHMLALVPGRERTAAELAALLRAADLDLVDTTSADPRSGLHVLTARPI